jgi:hypothetical protein
MSGADISNAGAATGAAGAGLSAILGPWAIPLIAAGAGLGAYGATDTRNEQINNQAAMADARNKVLQSYLDTIKGYTNENEATAGNVIDQFSQPNQEAVLSNDQANREADVLAAIAPLTSADYNDVRLSGNDPPGVKADIASRILAGYNKAATTAAGMAKLGGYADQWNGNKIAIDEGQRPIDTVNRFANAQTALVPELQDFAQYGAYKPASGTGQLYSALGNVFGAVGGNALSAGARPTNPAKPTASLVSDPTLIDYNTGAMIGGGP